MRNKNTKRYAFAIIAVSAFAASAAYSVYHGLYISAAMLSVGILVDVLISRHMSISDKRLERDTLAFLDNLAKGNNAHAFEKRIEMALNSSFVFYGDFKKALHEFELSGDAYSAFNKLKKYDKSMYFEIAAMLMQESLESGTDVSYALQSLNMECLEHYELKSKHMGEVANFKSLQFMGNVLFFPMFGGLSMNVLKLGTTSVSMHVYGVFGVAVLLYIFISNLITAIFAESGAMNRVVSISMRIALASFVFELSGAMASTLI